jgi:prepilin-type processing-associated H-X9-DG protein
MGASSAHPDGVQMLMVDGSARVVRPSIEEHVWRRYATVNDGGSTPGQGPSAPQPASDAASKAEPSD